MPLVRIDVVAGLTPAQKQGILDGVHAALVECFGIPDHDRTQLLNERPAQHFERAPGRSDRFTLIEITAFPGRSAEAKRRLFEAIVRNLAASPGVAPEDVFVVIQEPPLENWGIRGGKQASEVKLPFKLDV